MFKNTITSTSVTCLPKTVPPCTCEEKDTVPAGTFHVKE